MHFLLSWKHMLQVLFPVRIHINIWSTIQRSPFWILLEQPHRNNMLPRISFIPSTSPIIKTHIPHIRRKPMINPRRQNNQIILLQYNPHPLITFTPYIKEPHPIPDITYLLILMQVLVEEHLDFLLVYVAHFLGGHGDGVAVLVTAGGG